MSPDCAIYVVHLSRFSTYTSYAIGTKRAHSTESPSQAAARDGRNGFRLLEKQPEKGETNEQISVCLGDNRAGGNAAEWARAPGNGITGKRGF